MNSNSQSNPGFSTRQMIPIRKERLSRISCFTTNVNHPTQSLNTFHNYSKQHMAVCGLSLCLRSLESRKTLKQKIHPLKRHSKPPQCQREYFIQLLYNSFLRIIFPPTVYSTYKHTHNIPPIAMTKG